MNDPGAKRGADLPRFYGETAQSAYLTHSSWNLTEQSRTLVLDNITQSVYQ